MKQIAERLGFLPDEVDVLLLADGLIDRRLPPDPPSPVGLSEAERRELARTALAAASAFASRLEEGLARASREAKATEAHARAAADLARLLPLPPAERRAVALFPEVRSWALAVRLCEASIEAAADRAGLARELAGLACELAEQVEEEPEFRRRLEGYCRIHFGNALRVANDFDGADQAVARGWERWRAGTDGEPPVLAEWRLLSLEASLRRAQHRFAQALELIERARAASGEDAAAVARLLLKKGNVLEQEGKVEAALAVLEEAAPWVTRAGDERLLFGHLIDSSRQPQLAFAHRFNTADNLTRLARHAEAAALLPEVQALAGELGKDLHQLRVRWLAARIDAGLGRKEEALAALEQVQQDFTRLALPYDAALSVLDLALLWLEAGRTAEVRGLARGLAWIFSAQGIHREALAALKLFCDAARRDAATVALARQVVADVESARRLPPGTGKPARA